MTKERDSQQGKLYKAEKILEQYSKRLETMPEITAFAERVLLRAPVQARYGQHLRWAIQIKDGRRCRNALGGTNWVKLPKWSRTEYIVLHELAHTICRRMHGVNVAGHGWQYAAIYLDLVWFGLGAEARDALKASFRQHRVRFTPKKGQPRPPAAPGKALQPVAGPRAVKSPKRTKAASPRALNHFRALKRIHGFTSEIERERDGSGIAWISLSAFGPFPEGWSTMHYDWDETVRRLEACLADPSLVDEIGGYAE